MKYLVFVTLVGHGCAGEVEVTTFQHEVVTEQECFARAKEYAELPFVSSARCEIRTEKP